MLPVDTVKEDIASVYLDNFSLCVRTFSDALMKPCARACSYMSGRAMRLKSV